MIPPTAVAHDPGVQRMLAWSLATRLKRQIGDKSRIQHWSHDMYHGLTVSNEDETAAVIIDYEFSIYVQAGGSEKCKFPNAWPALLEGVPFRRVVTDLARHLQGTEQNDVEPVRTVERGVAYEIIAAMLRLSVQRGMRWICDSPIATPWELKWKLLWPHLPSLNILPENLPQFPGWDEPESPQQLIDWSFVHGPAGPVCAIDPDHWLMFPDGTRWSLLDLAKARPWKVAAAVATKVAAEPAPVGGVLGLQHSFATVVTNRLLFAHEASGGRILDHEIYGPIPVLRSESRRLLEKASGLRIPPHALALRGVQATTVPAPPDLRDYKELAQEENGVLDLLVVWSASTQFFHSVPPGILIVMDPARAGSTTDYVLPVAHKLGAINSAVLTSDGVSGPDHGCAFRLLRAQSWA